MPRTKAVMIFLMIFAATLGIYIGMQSLSIYWENKNVTETTATPSIDCAKYMFSVKNPSYDGYAASFEITNEKDLSLENFHSVTVVGVTQKSAETKNFIPGTTRQIKINDINIDKNFSVYVDECAVYKKTCILEENSCS